MQGSGTAIAGGGDVRNTPAAAHVPSLAAAARASVAASLDKGRQAGHGERTRRRAGVSLAPAPAGDARRAPGRARGPLRRRATANASVNAIRGALRAAWLSGDMDRARLERSLAALQQVRGTAAPGRALSPLEARRLFAAVAADRNRAAGARGPGGHMGEPITWKAPWVEVMRGPLVARALLPDSHGPNRDVVGHRTTTCGRHLDACRIERAVGPPVEKEG